MDSACSSTVCGVDWLNCYLEALTQDKLAKVKEYESSTYFKFGGGRKLKSIKKVTIPCEIAGVCCNITTDVVNSDLPLLLGKPSMKKARVILDLENDKASMFGNDVDLHCTSAGHYCIPINGPEIDGKETIQVLFSMEDKDRKEKEKVIRKLHQQFAHPTSQRLKLLLKDAGIKDQECIELVEDITNRCDICLKYKKTPPRPVVSLPLARDFNETVAMDLKHWDKNIWFLHLIDLATRFSVSSVITSKHKEVVLNKILLTGLGTPSKFFTDNGGEFC